MRRKENSSETHKTKRYYEVSSEKLQKWSDTIEKLNKQCYDYKAENDTLIDELSWYKAKANRLERENEFLRQVPPMSEDTEFTVAKPLTELQLTKDSSVQGVPLTNEAYEKAIEEGK